MDWQRGLAEALAPHGVALTQETFDRVIDAQSSAEASQFLPYRTIVARSLMEVFGLSPAVAAIIGAQVGEWPFFDDSVQALQRISTLVPCAAITNSDHEHGAQIRARLGFAIAGWVCAEGVTRYKPDPALWRVASRELGLPFGSDWWHVSAYADYDLTTAGQLGLTRVFVRRPVARPGGADLTVGSLKELADIVSAG